MKNASPLTETSARLRGRLVTGVGLGSAITLCHVLQGLCLAFLTASLLVRYGSTGMSGAPLLPVPLFGWLIAIALILLVRSVLLWRAEVAAQATAQTVKEDLRRQLLTHLLTLGPGIVQRRNMGELQTTIVSGVEAVESYYSRYLPALSVAVIGCAAVLVLIAAIDWPSALLLTIFVVALPFLDRFWMRWQMPAVSGVFAAMGAFGSELLDSLQGILTLKAFNASNAWRNRLAARAATLSVESINAAKVTMMRTGVTGLVSLSGVALVLCVNAWRVADGSLEPFVLFITLFLAREAFRPLDRLEKEFHTAWAAGGARQSIDALLALTPPVSAPAKALPEPAQANICFDQVTFAYEDSALPALNAVSFEIAQNEFVALVGPSGAGKSTITTLLARFFDPTAGAIRIGGQDLRDMSFETLRSLVSVVPQETMLFQGTLADNLRIAKPDASEAEMRAAIEAAHLTAFVDGLSQGLDTPVGERGAGLSGGQRQRFAIARALLKDAPILILDEATSNVDPASEKAIQEAIEAIGGRRTLIVIAHRLSTVQSADRILVFNEGRLVEQGSPDTLIADDGHYARLVRAGGDIE